MQPLDLALQYHADGWPVFPCRSGDEELPGHDPETGEIKVLRAKTPHNPNGFKGASKFERIIRRWWSDFPDAVVGVPTGEPIGAWVLDIDVKAGANGFDTLKELTDKHGELPPTSVCETPSGGRHYYFNHVSGVRNRGELGQSIDVRGDGGYVVAPGSVMADGRTYRWIEENPIADAPDWLLALVVRKQPTSTHSAAPRVGELNSAYVSAAVQSELDDLALTPMGDRNNSLNDSAYALGQFVGAGGLPEHEARSMLQDVARGWGRDWALCCKTIESGLKAGIAAPRVIPEPSYQEVSQSDLAIIKRIIESAHRKAAGSALQTVSDEPGAIDPEPDPEASPSPITATAFKWIDPKTLPRREFAYGTHYIRKYVSVTVAPGGLGKTSNSILEALSMTSGRMLVGVKPPQRMNVWLFNAEDPRDELDRRIMAACLHYKMEPKDLEGRLFIDSGREQELMIAEECKKTGFKINIPIVEAVIAEIERNKIDVLIVDPFVSTHGVNENDNGAIDRVAKLWAQIADHTNCAIDIIHHLRKISDREASVEDSRGAVSLIGAARSVRVLNRMTSEQAGQAAIPADDRTKYFSITHGKSNLTPLSHRQDWRRMESVPLGNGGVRLGRGGDNRARSEPQDHAPVVTEWVWPTAEKMTEELTAEQKQAICVAVSNSDFKESPKAKNWIGQAIAFALDLDIEDEASRKRAGAIARALIKEGVLVKSAEKDPVRRETATFVRAA